uniref:Uncharacterized protein n=1 Tax=Neogobius melanostomus TaxID=47308 RepID=A0A8C6X017_9GOBI
CASVEKRAGKSARGQWRGESSRMCRAMRRTDAERRRWFRCSGKGGKGRAARGSRRCPPCVPRRHAPLRPVNVRGHSAKGMRAPENTNQFLMTEKYRLHALRSDSVDSDVDSDAERADLDAYLCAWEDAHGALLDPDTTGTEGDWRDRLQAAGTFLCLDINEDSAQYFPSEDDLNHSDNFMDRDFAEFCHTCSEQPITAGPGERGAL